MGRGEACTCTVRACPMRCARASACCSSVAFQESSAKNTWLGLGLGLALGLGSGIASP